MVELTECQRARVQVLRRLARDGGPLAPTAPTATIHNPAWFRPSIGRRLRPTPERLALHDDLVDAFYEKRGRGDIGNRAVMLAGPPGAGKGTIRARILQEAGQRFTVADPDEFKELLIEDAQRRGWLEELVPAEAREAGFVLAPMELSALVHEESSHLARLVRTVAINQGANLVIDSVMAREAPALQQAKTLESRGYGIEVLNVQVPQELSQARILQRWATDSTKPFGGRWVPSEFRQDVFSGDHEAVSWPDRNARTVAERVDAVERYRRYFTTVEMDAAGQSARLTHDLRRGSDGRLREQGVTTSHDPAFPPLPDPRQAGGLPPSMWPPSSKPSARGKRRGR